MSGQVKKNSAGQIISLVAALAVLLCFFLPWVEVGSSFLKTTLSGYQIATGSGPAGANIPSWGLLLLVPIGMIAVAALTIAQTLGFSPQAQARPITSIVIIAAGFVSAALILYQYFDLNAALNEDLLGVIAQNFVSHTFGWGASLFGSFLVLAGGVVELRKANLEKPRSMAAGGF
jgi:hypothetical protein